MLSLWPHHLNFPRSELEEMQQSLILKQEIISLSLVTHVSGCVMADVGTGMNFSD